jgi:lipopolysaccharide export system permease protein
VTLFFIIAIFSIIAVIFDISEKIDNFIEKRAPLQVIIFQYYFSFIPYLSNLVSPLLVFISALYFTSRMAYNSEIIAILSSGISFKRVLQPYIAVAIFLFFGSLYLQNWLIPKSNKRMVEFEATYIDRPFVNQSTHIHRQIEPGVFIYMENFYNLDSTGYKFSLEKFNDNQLYYKLRGRMIKWSSTDSLWTLHDYTLREIDGMHESLRYGSTIKLNLNITPEDFGKKVAEITTMTTPELNRFIEIEKMRGEELIDYYLVEKYRRVSIPFANFILIVLAVAVSSRKLRGGIGLHLGIGILISFAYLMFLHFSSIFAINANLNPFIAVWMPNVVFGILAVYLVIKAPK